MPEAVSAHRSLRALLGLNLGAAALIFALLEIWRPYYFLTDDSLDCFFPVLAGMGQRMLHGQLPFTSDYLFGGHHDMLRDCIFFLWHPVYLLAGLIANTPVRFCALEMVAFFFLMVTVAGFVCLAHDLRRQLDLKLSDARLSLLALSFTYSMIILCVGPSWMNYLGNHSAMPWLALGIVQTSWRRGLGIVALFSIHHILGGHLEVTVPVTLFFTLFAVGVAWSRRSWAPLLSWCGGYAMAVVLLSPLLLPAASGFLASGRAGGLPAWQLADFSMPAILFPFSLFLSTFSLRLETGYQFGECALVYSSAFVSCAAAWMLIPALASRARWRGLEITSLAMAALAALLVIRPHAVNEVMAHLPLLRSLRWPFRQIVEFQFFLHLFLVLRPLEGSPLFRRGLMAAGIVIFLAPLPFLAPPTFGPMRLDRALLFSGAADAYWAGVKTQLGPEDVIVTVADPVLLESNVPLVPFTLLGTANYPAFFQVRNASGYSLTVPRAELYLQLSPETNMGVFAPGQKAAILAERPNVRFLTLESVKPLRITLSAPDGPPIDLTALYLKSK